MNVSVKVKAGAKQDKIEKIAENQFVVRVKEKPVEGRANEAVVNVLSEYFDVPKSKVVLLRGHKSTQKVFGIL